MFHLKPNPSPPCDVGRVTPGHAVDSSATESTPGSAAWTRLVEQAEELDGVEVFAATLRVGLPLPRARE